MFGGAVTSKPANPMAFITEGKGGSAQVVTVAQEVEAGRALRDPDHDRHPM